MLKRLTASIGTGFREFARFYKNYDKILENRAKRVEDERQRAGEILAIIAKLSGPDRSRLNTFIQGSRTDHPSEEVAAGLFAAIDTLPAPEDKKRLGIYLAGHNFRLILTAAAQRWSTLNGKMMAELTK